jgi:hypothetical protein
VIEYDVINMKANSISFLIATCLLALISCTKEAPKILIIGDSISIGYTPYVKEMLGERAYVEHNEGNAQHSGTGLEEVISWIGEEKWDIVQFNWGLWDLAYRHEDSETQGKRDKIKGIVTFTPEQYRSNLDSLVRIIKSSTKAKLLFVSTSYVPEGEKGRFVKDAPIYNKVAKEVMAEYKIPVNDLYDFSKEIHAEHSTAANNVHYTKDGYKLLANKIIEGLAQFDSRLNENN